MGILVGVSTSVFLWVLEWATLTLGRLPWSLWLLPLGFLVASLLVQLFAPEAEGHGTEKVIEAVHRRWGRIQARVAPVKLAATILTIAVGGSVGKEGPCAQIGAALASSLASLLRLSPRDRRKIVVCGISAGFATVFGTPSRAPSSASRCSISVPSFTTSSIRPSSRGSSGTRFPAGSA